MERNIHELDARLSNQGADPIVLWATCLARRKAQNRNLRNIKPTMVRLEAREGNYNRRSSIIEVNSGKELSYYGNAWEANLHIFDTEQEAIDFYNTQVGKIVDMINIGIVKLEQEKRKAEALRLGR